MADKLLNCYRSRLTMRNCLLGCPQNLQEAVLWVLEMDLDGKPAPRSAAEAQQGAIYWCVFATPLERKALGVG